MHGEVFILVVIDGDNFEKFNPIRTHEVMPGTIAFVVRTEYDPAKPMGNIAAYDIHAAVSAFLVRYDEQTTPILPRALEWLDKAIEESEGERFGPLPLIASRDSASPGQGPWSVDVRQGDEASWKIAQDAQIEYMRTGFTKERVPTSLITSSSVSFLRKPEACRIAEECCSPTAFSMISWRSAFRLTVRNRDRRI